MNLRSMLYAILTITLMLGLMTFNAFADSEVITINTANSGLNTGVGGCCTGPYATVTIDRTDTTHATVTFDSLTNGGFIYLIGSHNGAAVNVNGDFSVSGITGSNSLSGFSAPTLTDGGASGMDGFGNFNESIMFFDGFTHTVTELQFALTATNGNSWSSVGNVLTGNAGGFEVAYHGFACATSVMNPCNGGSGAAITGFASTGAPAVPEPTSLYLSGALIGVLALVGQFRRRKVAE